jgi:hypothetical protein
MKLQEIGHGTLLLSNEDDLTRRFREFFPQAIDLDAYIGSQILRPEFPRPPR